VVSKAVIEAFGWRCKFQHSRARIEKGESEFVVDEDEDKDEAQRSSTLQPRCSSDLRTYIQLPKQASSEKLFEMVVYSTLRASRRSSPALNSP
jgi:hypothetical protein